MPSHISSLGHDPEYLTKREAEERRAAERSVDPTARRAHQSLAEQYARRLRTLPPA